MGNSVIGCCDCAALKGEDVAFSCPQPLPSELGAEAFAENPYAQGSRLWQLPSTTPLILRLEVLSSTTLATGTQLFIKPQGLVGSGRNASDGLTFFGCRRKLSGEVVNDFVIPCNEGTRGRHFLVYFHPVLENYWLKDLSSGSGLFLKLESAFVLRTNMLINFGETFITFEVDGSTLALRVFNSEHSGTPQ